MRRICFGARVAHDDAAVGGVGDDDADGDGVEDGLKAGFASAEGLFGFFVVVDVFECAVPADDLSVFVSARGGARAHPAPVRRRCDGCGIAMSRGLPVRSDSSQALRVR